jgi:phospholipase/carboxylesterase
MNDPHAHLPVETAGAPLGEGRGAAILIHGRGASAHNILDLVPAIALPSFTYLAPSAADRTWYPFSFMHAIEQNEPKLSSALARIHTLIEEAVNAGVPADRIVLIGFSQGACLAGEYAVRHAQRYGGVAMLSGGLIGPPGTRWPEAGGFAGTPVFLGCSDRDPHIPLARVHESTAVFSRMGAAVTERIYPDMGHLVSAEEVSEVRNILDAIR